MLLLHKENIKRIEKKQNLLSDNLNPSMCYHQKPWVTVIESFCFVVSRHLRNNCKDLCFPLIFILTDIFLMKASNLVCVCVCRVATAHSLQQQISVFVVVKAYPYEDQRAGVSNFVLPLWHLDHGKLSWTGTLAQNLPDLQGHNRV